MSIPIPRNVSVAANIEMYHYNPATRQRGLRAIVGITMTTTSTYQDNAKVHGLHLWEALDK